MTVWMRHYLVRSLIAGLVMASMAPPSPLGLMSPVILALWLALVEAPSGREAFRIGFLAGVPFHIITLGWLTNAMSVGPMAIMIAGFILLTAFLSSFHGLLAWVWHRSRLSRPWLLVPVWTAVEVLRTKGEVSFPWLHVAYNLAPWPQTVQPAAWIGVFGVGMALVAAAVGFRLLASSAVRQNPLRRRRLEAGLGAGFALWFLICAASWWGRSPDVEDTVRVAIAQPSVPQTSKWDEAHFEKVMARTWNNASRLATDVDLVVFPETALSDLWSVRPREAAGFQAVADRMGVPVVVGALEVEFIPHAPRGRVFRNSAFFLQPGGNPFQARRFDKVFLVPFSETLPFTDLIPLLNFVDLGEGDFSRGTGMKVWQVPVPFSPSICYELVYPQAARQAVHGGARLLVNITNDGWFGNSAGPWQHWSIHRFRAIESGLPLVRAANTGLSGAVDRRGALIARTRLMADTTLRVEVPLGPQGGSFASRHGHLLEVLWVVLGLLSLTMLLYLRPKPLS